MAWLQTVRRGSATCRGWWPSWSPSLQRLRAMSGSIDFAPDLPCSPIHNYESLWEEPQLWANDYLKKVRFCTKE